MKNILKEFSGFYSQARAEGQGIIESIESAILLSIGAMTRPPEENEGEDADAEGLPSASAKES